RGWRAPAMQADREGTADGTSVRDDYGSAERPPVTPDDTDPAGKRGPAGEGATAEEGKDECARRRRRPRRRLRRCSRTSGTPNGPGPSRRTAPAAATGRWPRPSPWRRATSSRR